MLHGAAAQWRGVHSMMRLHMPWPWQGAVAITTSTVALACIYELRDAAVQGAQYVGEGQVG